MSEIQKPKPTFENLKVYESLMQEYRECRSDDNSVQCSLLNKVQVYYEQFDWFCSIFEEQGALGVKDTFGNIVVQAQYEEIWNLPVYQYMNMIPIIAKKNGLLGLVRVYNGVAREITDFEYDGAYAVEFTSFTAVRKAGTDKWGLVDIEGNELIPAEMDKIYPQSTNGNIFVEKDGKEGVFDYVLGGFAYPEYDSIEGMGEGGVLTFVKNGVEGHVDIDGKFYDMETLNRFYNGEEYDAIGNVIYEGDDEEPIFLSDHLD